VVLPLLATQLLWINLVTDGVPALALGVDPPNPTMSEPLPPKGRRADAPHVARHPARRRRDGATLMVLDASLPAGVIEGTGTLRHGQTMVFTTLMLFQLFNVFSARSADRSAFEDAFTNP
jgi:P-type Ca2+ transporter type 2C